MTPRQSWAIFCLSKMDVRHAELDMEKASSMIDALKAGGTRFEAAVQTLKSTPGAVSKGEVKPKQDWKALFERAHDSGYIAGTMALPKPMVLVAHANPADDSSPVTERVVVNEGPCGFAWVTVRPATCAFAQWLKKNGLARVGYHGGMQMPVHLFNQSITRKERYADAFAAELRKANINAIADSRLD